MLYSQVSLSYFVTRARSCNRLVYQVKATTADKSRNIQRTSNNTGFVPKTYILLYQLTVSAAIATRTSLSASTYCVESPALSGVAAAPLPPPPVAPALISVSMPCDPGVGDAGATLAQTNRRRTVSFTSMLPPSQVGPLARLAGGDATPPWPAAAGALAHKD